jgi:hypothetical protein
MAYKKIKSYDLTEAELRKIWKDEYCENEIITFDGVTVKCYEDMFDHIFFESNDREKKDKSIFSLNRLEKMHWIKDTLQDETAILKKGWDSKQKKYFKDRRVALVKGNYVVIIRFTGLLKAKLVTAYEKTDIENILNSPDFERSTEFFGEEA